MLGLQTLDVILGLVFVFLLLSLVCTAVTEVLAQWLNWRAATLEQGIRTLLGDLPERRKPGRRSDSAREAAPGDGRGGVPTALAAGTAGERVAPAEWQALTGTIGRFAPSSGGLATAAAQPLAYPAGAGASAAPAPPRAGDDMVRVARLYSHPLIAGLSQVRRTPLGVSARHIPSYIPSRTFAIALLDLIAPPGPDGPATMEQLRAGALRLPEQLGRPLVLFIDDVGDDVERLRTSLERWYQDAMVRVSGLYKRKTQAAILLIAAVVTVAANADAIRIGRSLASNATLRDAVVAHAQGLAANPAPDVRELLRLDSARLARAATSASELGEEEPEATPALRPDSVTAFRLGQIRSTIDTLQSLGLPLGWSAPEGAPRPGAGMLERFWAGVKHYAADGFPRLPGLLITIFAVSLGAPFWFDVLNKIVNIRATGRAPEERPKPPEALPPARGA